jgi:hypothetical protein
MVEHSKPLWSSIVQRTVSTHTTTWPLVCHTAMMDGTKVVVTHGRANNLECPDANSTELTLITIIDDLVDLDTHSSTGPTGNHVNPITQRHNFSLYRTEHMAHGRSTLHDDARAEPSVTSTHNHEKLFSGRRKWSAFPYGYTALLPVSRLLSTLLASCNVTESLYDQCIASKRSQHEDHPDGSNKTSVEAYQKPQHTSSRRLLTRTWRIWVRISTISALHRQTQDP